MKKIFLLLSFSISFLPQLSFACDCLPIASARDAKKSSTHIFSGTVIDRERITLEQINPNYKEYIITLMVHNIWKGFEGKKIKIRTPFLKSDCSTYLENSHKYLIYAVGGEVPVVNFCSRTSHLNSDRARDDLFYLGKPQVKN